MACCRASCWSVTQLGRDQPSDGGPAPSLAVGRRSHQRYTAGRIPPGARPRRSAASLSGVVDLPVAERDEVMSWSRRFPHRRQPERGAVPTHPRRSSSWCVALVRARARLGARRGGAGGAGADGARGP